MKVLVTGAKGFIGKNLCRQLQNIKEGKARNYGDLKIEEVFRYDIDTDPSLLDEYCREADFVFNLAGVNRPKDEKEFIEGNLGFAALLVEKLQKYGNKCPVMFSSSIQASLDNPYGKSKLAGENLLREYAKQTGADIFIYRFPNVFGKWCRPNYNSVIATFCHNIARDLPITINDPKTELTLVYVDDVVDELISALKGQENRSGEFCGVSVVYKVTLGEIAELLEKFHAQQDTLMISDAPAGSFEKKLCATYLSYLPGDRASFPHRMNKDARGSFTELLKTKGCGQVSVNISLPGITRGEHWHNTKWEIFTVVSGHGLIRQRKIGSDKIYEYEVSGDNIESVRMLPGYTHSIVNLSDTENLVTVMWANELYDPESPDTYFENVGDGK